MSYDPSAPVRVVQVTPVQRTSAFTWLFRIFFFLVLLISVGANVILLLALVGVSALSGMSSTDEPTSGVVERFESGDANASDKIAVMDVEGVLLEGLIGFTQKQIEHASKDNHVKAIVLRIQSPGGSITASDHIYHKLVELRDGSASRGTAAKPIIVSMGSLAASGGYYIAMPAQRIIAERTTMTGSIGVYAALPNVKALADKIGVRMDVIKAGEVKDSGSPFADMTEKEKLMWQQLVDQSYLQFIDIVEKGRPALKGKLQEDVRIDETIPVRTDKGPTQTLKYTRYRADGGIYTAPEALKLGLIDQIGYVEDAIEAARQAAKLGSSYKAVRYERPITILGSLLGVNARASGPSLELNALAESVTPRLWYLAPGAGATGLLAASKK